MIIVSGQEAGTNTDILNGTRLLTIGLGRFLVELQASDNNSVNNFTASLELPDGQTPFTAMRVPSGTSAGLAGVIDDRTAFKFTLISRKTGHAVLSTILTGAAELTWRVSAVAA